jgi:hypothetical protein
MFDNETFYGCYKTVTCEFHVVYKLTLNMMKMTSELLVQEIRNFMRK